MVVLQFCLFAAKLVKECVILFPQLLKDYAVGGIEAERSVNSETIVPIVLDKRRNIGPCHGVKKGLGVQTSFSVIAALHRPLDFRSAKPQTGRPKVVYLCDVALPNFGLVAVWAANSLARLRG